MRYVAMTDDKNDPAVYRWSDDKEELEQWIEQSNKRLSCNAKHLILVDTEKPKPKTRSKKNA